MFLIAGLGNPGPKYKNTRHNIGFRTIDNLQLTIDNFSDWKKAKKLKSEISRGKIDNYKVVLAKPQTFMNLSGQAVKVLTRRYTLDPKNLIIIHDDIDLPLGEIKIVKNRGSAGHKGVESIVRELKTKDFVRFRIGINRFAQNQKLNIKNQKLDEFVLKKFNKEEEKIVKEVIKKTIEAIGMMVKEGLEKAMTVYNH